MDSTDLAREGIEHAHGHREQTTDSWTVRAAMLIAILAAAAVVAEMSAGDAETQYLATHISATDTWAQYQAKSVRRTVYLQSLAVLEAVDPHSKRMVGIRREADRMASEPGKDGMEQLAKGASMFESQRDHALRLRDGFELSVRGLQIAVVLSSLAVATRAKLLLSGCLVLGVVAATYALLVGFGAL